MRLLKQVQLLQLNPASLLFPAVTAASVSGASGAVNAAAKTATTAAEARRYASSPTLTNPTASSLDQAQQQRPHSHHAVIQPPLLPQTQQQQQQQPLWRSALSSLPQAQHFHLLQQQQVRGLMTRSSPLQPQQLQQQQLQQQQLQQLVLLQPWQHQQLVKQHWQQQQQWRGLLGVARAKNYQDHNQKRPKKYKIKTPPIARRRVVVGEDGVMWRMQAGRRHKRYKKSRRQLQALKGLVPLHGAEAAKLRKLGFKKTWWYGIKA